MRTAVVTGGASGIGKATADLFEQRGWDVVRIDRTAGDGVCTADITDFESLDTVVQTLAGRRVDALVCAAGILLAADNRYSNVDLEAWDRTQAVNVKGTMLTLRAFAPLLSAGSAVVTVASMAALVGIPKHDAYTASKGAIVALTRAWATDLIRFGIRVNAVAPGVVETPMTVNSRAQDEGRLPLGRAATPFEIASVIFSLALPESGYLNGAVVPVDGGATAASRLVSLSPRRPEVV